MLRPTFLAFETAKKALNISQLGLDTVGHNIANSSTPGYTRQRVDQVSISLGGHSTKYQTFGAQLPGLGAGLQGINQIRDPYLDNRYRAEAAVNGELAVKGNGLTDINSIFDEIMTDGLHSKMGDLINSLDVFAQSADSRELGMVVRNTANQLISILNKNATDLEAARVQQKLDLNVSVEQDVNSILEKIASLNKKIKEDNFYGNPANELNDERNLLLDNLSEYLDIKITKTPVKISSDLTIYELGIELNGVTDEKGKPISLVNDGQFNKLKVKEDATTGNVSISVVDAVSGFDLHGDVTNKLYKGGIKGYVDIINGAGPSSPTGISTYKGIPYYQAALDEFAQKLATVFNSVNNITPAEAANSGNPPLLSPTYEKNLFGPLTPTLKGVSSTEGVPAWMGSVASGTLGFSNSTYTYEFATNHPTAPDKITARLTSSDGTVHTYTADYKPDSVIEFKGTDGTVAFTVATTGVVPPETSRAVVDATVTARNISLTPNWLENPLYVTTTKFNPVTQAKPSLFLTGNQPAWLKSVEYGGEDVNVPDGSYEFKIDSINKKLQVAIPSGSSNYYYYDLPSPDYKLPKNTTIELKDASGNVGLKITTTGNDFGTTGAENTANIKNSSGAANDNILKFKEAIKGSNAYSVTGTSGSFEEYLAAFQGEMADDQNYNDSLLEASTLLIAGFADRRDAVSAVSIDEEGINMMQYQNYYNASARYMTTLDEALDKIINGMGTVGR